MQYPGPTQTKQNPILAPKEPLQKLELQSFQAGDIVESEVIPCLAVKEDSRSKHTFV